MRQMPVVSSDQKKARVKERGRSLLKGHAQQEGQLKIAEIASSARLRRLGSKLRVRQLRNGIRLFTTDAKGIQLLASRYCWGRTLFYGYIQAEISQVPGQHLDRINNICPEPILRAVMKSSLKQEGHQLSVHFFIVCHDLFLILFRPQSPASPKTGE